MRFTNTFLPAFQVVLTNRVRRKTWIGKFNRTICSEKRIIRIYRVGYNIRRLKRNSKISI